MGQIPLIFGLSIVAKRLDGSRCAWHVGRPQPRPHCARRGPSSPSPKRGQSPPTFGPCLLWPNSWMDQDTTWYEGRPWPRLHCITWGSSSSTRGTAPIPPFSAHVYCGQTLGRPSQLLLSTCFILWNSNKSSAAAEMGDRLATIDMGRKVGRGCCGGRWVSIGSPSNTM